MTNRQSRHPLRVLVFDASLGPGRSTIGWRPRGEASAARGGTVDRGRMADFDGPSYDVIEKSRAFPPAPSSATATRGRRRVRDRVARVQRLHAGGLKNAIDWVSRARPQPFNGKQGLLLSASPSMAGGNRGLWALRVPLEHLGARVYPDMFSLAQAHQAFDANGEHRQRRPPETVRADHRVLPGSGRGGGVLPGAQEALGGVPGRTSRSGHRPGRDRDEQIVIYRRRAPSPPPTVRDL